MPTMRDDGGNTAIVARAFRPLSGTPAVLAVTNTSGAATLTQAIPPEGCHVRIAVTGTGGNVRVRIGPTAAATSSDMLLLVGTVEVFSIFSGDAINAILDTGTSGTNLSITLGVGG